MSVNKPSVFVMVKRGGNIATRVVPNHWVKMLMPMITQVIAEEVIAHTDDFSGYDRLFIEVAGHQVIHHCMTR